MRRFPREWMAVYRKGGWYRVSAVFYLAGLLCIPFGGLSALILWHFPASFVMFMATMLLFLVCMYASLAAASAARSKAANDAFATLLANLNNPDRE